MKQIIDPAPEKLLKMRHNLIRRWYHWSLAWYAVFQRILFFNGNRQHLQGRGVEHVYPVVVDKDTSDLVRLITDRLWDCYESALIIVYMGEVATWRSVCHNFPIDVFKLMLKSLRFQSMAVTTCLVFGGAQQVLSLFFPYTRQEYISKACQPTAWLISLYLRTFQR